MKEAMLYEKLPDSYVRCNLCAHHCLIADGRKGICQVRENRDGKLRTSAQRLQQVLHTLELARLDLVEEAARINERS